MEISRKIAKGELSGKLGANKEPHVINYESVQQIGDHDILYMDRLVSFGYFLEY